MRAKQLILGVLLALCSAAQTPATEPELVASRDVQTAFEGLVRADHWRDVNRARDRLAECGEGALTTVVAGTQHEKKDVREACFEILLDRFPREPKAINAIIEGLGDTDYSIRYICAFHLGKHGTEEAKAPLKACVAADRGDAAMSMARYAAAKSLAELGVDSVAYMLYEGLGSDGHYTRYLSNIGMKALCGRDLTDFGYESPWEGASVSGPGVFGGGGAPVEEARRKLNRWQAVVEFIEWLKEDRPVLFQRVESPSPTL